MRERKLGRLAIAVIAAALVGCLALALPTTGAAKKKKKKPALVTTTVSSGSLAVPIPDADSAAAPDNDTTASVARVPVALRIPARATITDVKVDVRLDHNFDADVEVHLASPRGVILLSRDIGGAGDNYGSGATSCAGTPTTFDSKAATPIAAGTAPFVGTFAPQGSLAVLNGLKGIVASMPWTLEVSDDESVDTGTLYCWNLTVQYRTPPKKKRK
jgi:subtilisin-like proprotein convertase family protein